MCFTVEIASQDRLDPKVVRDSFTANQQIEVLMIPFLRKNSGRTVASCVFEGANHIVRATAGDNRLSQLLEELVGSPRRQFTHVPSREPGFKENLFNLQGMERGIAVSLRWQGRSRRQVSGIVGPQPFSPKVIEQGGIVSLSAHAF